MPSPLRSTLGGTRNAFALKLNSTGNALLYSTYLGGSTYDTGTAIAVDGSGNAYIAGDAQSADFPVANAAQPVFGGQTDAFVTKLNSSGAISFSTFLGGAATEHAGGVAVDLNGNIYVAGGTFSTNFPVVAAIQTTSGGGEDVFLAKLSPGGSSILFSTYLGGSGGTQSAPEQANAVAVDGSGNTYVTGVTNSANFPMTAGAFQASFGGTQDAFSCKINTVSATLVYSTYLGGLSFDWATGIAVDAGGNSYVSGYTSSSSFPTVTGVQTAFNGVYDAFVSKIGAAGNALAFSTFYGGSGSDVANAIALDASGNIFVGGETGSLDLPLQSPIYSTNTGGATGWVARLGVTAPPPQMPAANSVSPSSGSGNTVTFTAQYSHPAGATSLTSVALLVNSTASTDFACYVSYNPAANQFTLANDVASSGAVTVNPNAGSAQNSQCTLNGVGSSASLSGTNLTLTVSLVFQPGFTGGKNVYLYAADSITNTGWVARGAWTVTIPPPQPSANSVSPNGSTGSTQTFNFTFSDTQNAANLSTVAMLFAPSFTFINACYIVYDDTRGTMQLAWDNVAGSSSKAITSTATPHNGQCAVGAASATFSGLSLVVTAAITFKGPFNGLQNIYMYAVEGVGSLNTGWVQNGTYTVAAGGVPMVNSVVPSSGAGPSQRFSFTVSDQGGSGFITDAVVAIGTSLNFANSCVLVYDRLNNTVSLSYDIPANGASQLVLGSSTTISNGQCALRGANTTVVFGTTSVVVTLDLLFNATYFGAKNIYLYAAEQNSSSGYVNVGTWTVTGGAPTADSVSPSSGSGLSNTFTLTVSDSANSANITGIAAFFTTSSPGNTANACYAVYNRTANTIGLYSNDWLSLATKPIGSSATLQNSQCAVGFTGMNISGNSVIFFLQLVFAPGFAGAKSVYLQANEPNAGSGWVSRGTWTVQ
jgi:hypothetical protein